MKRFLALFATLAIVVSMFSGIAFAETSTDGNYTLEASFETLYAGVEGDATVTLSATSEAPGLTGVWVENEVTKKDEDGLYQPYSHPDLSIKAEDEEGNWYEIANGNWGPVGGFALTPDYNVTTNVKALFPEVGSYRVTLTLTDGSTDHVTETVEFEVGYKYKVVLDTASVVGTKDFATYKVTGRIVDENGIVSSRNYDIAMGSYNTIASQGYFEFLINRADGVGEYTVTAVDRSASKIDVKSATFTIVNELELEDGIDYTYPVTGQKVVRGRLLDANGDPIANEPIWFAYQDEFNPADDTTADATAIVKVFTSSTGEFGFFVDSTDLDKVGDLGLYVGANKVLHAEGSVAAGTLEFTVNPTELANRLESANVEFEFDVPADYLQEDGLTLISDHSIQLVIKKGTARMWSASIGTAEHIQSLPITNWATGTYTVYATLKNSNTDILTGTATLTIAAPEKYTLVGWSFDKIDVGTTTISWPSGISVYKYNKYEDVSEQLQYYTVTAEGAGMKKVTASNLDSATTQATSIQLKPTECGVITVTIKAYEKATDTSPVATFVKEVVVSGYNVELSTDVIKVGESTDLTVSVTDADGNPINNAYIWISSNPDTSDLDNATINPTKVNVNGGLYFKTLKPSVVQALDVVVAINNNGVPKVMATIEDAIEVVGEAVYTVTADKDTLVNGLTEKVLVQITDVDGNMVYPHEVVYYEDGDYVGTLNISTRKDVDGDGVKESIELTITPGAKTSELTIRARTSDKKEHGDVTLTVAKPKLVVISGEKTTEFIKSTVVFKVVDPRDESVVFSDDITVSTTDVNELKLYEAGDKEPYATINTADEDETNDEATLINADEYLWEILVTDVDWETAEDEERNPSIDLVISLDRDVYIGSFEVAEAVLSANPETITIGVPNQVVLTYTDGNGNVLEGKKVYVGDDYLGTTNENGEVLYTVGQGTNTAVEFKAETDITDKFATVKVAATFDMSAPILEVPTEVDTDTVVLVVRDNVRIVRLMINGEEQNIFPVPEVKVFLQLQEGVNLVHVQAMDNNYNVLDELVEITYTPPAPVFEPVELTMGVDTGFGAPEKLVVGDAAVTMVPVRVAEQLLGATMDYVDGTVTYTLGDVTITATVGSTTATVNGENITLPVAPYIKEVNGVGRLFVPLRLIAQELGFNVEFTSWDAPIVITQ